MVKVFKQEVQVGEIRVIGMMDERDIKFYIWCSTTSFLFFSSNNPFGMVSYASILVHSSHCCCCTPYT